MLQGLFYFTTGSSSAFTLCSLTPAGRAIYKLHQNHYTNTMSNITIDELARMSQSEFTAVRGEIRDLHTEMNQKFDRVDEQFDSLTKVVLDIKGLIENSTEHLQERVTRVEETIGISK